MNPSRRAAADSGGRRALLVFCVLVSLLETVLWSALAPLVPGLVRDPGLSATAVGVLTAAYSMGIVIGAAPAGWAASRIGPRMTALVGLWVLAIGSSAFALSQSSLELDASRFVQGAGASAAWVGALAWIAGTFSVEERGGAIGLAISASFCGMLLGPLIGAIAASVGRHATFNVIAIGLGLLAIWGGPAHLKARRSVPQRASLRALRRPTMLVPVLSLFTFGVLTGAVGTLGPLLLDERGLGAGAIAACFVCAAVPQIALTARLGRRLGRSGLVQFCVGILLITGLLLPLTTLPRGAVMTAIFFSVAVIFLFLAFNPAILMVSAVAERAGVRQEFAMSLANGTWSLGSILGGIGLAALADGASMPDAFLAAGTLAAATGLMLASAVRAGVIPRSLGAAAREPAA